MQEDIIISKIRGVVSRATPEKNGSKSNPDLDLLDSLLLLSTNIFVTFVMKCLSSHF